MKTAQVPKRKDMIVALDIKDMLPSQAKEIQLKIHKSGEVPQK
jgi:hypothetical protein